MLQILVYLTIFILGFGIASQALLDPNHPPGWRLFTNILWRPYWAVYRERHLHGVNAGWRIHLIYLNKRDQRNEI